MAKKHPFESRGWYNPKIHGSLEKYLEEHNGRTVFPLFKGYKHFKMLWDRGYITPEITFIRIMYNVGRGDEYYLVIDEDTLEGVTAGFHSGKPGRHNIKQLLDNSPSWSTEDLNPNPTPRKKSN